MKDTVPAKRIGNGGMGETKRLRWQMFPGAELSERLRPPLSRVRIASQWTLHGITLAAVLAEVPWLYLAGAFVFFLQFIGSYRTAAYCASVLRTVPILTDRDGAGAPAHGPRVLVVSPARNEESDIEVALTSLLAQDYRDVQVVAINDHSTDSTPDILRRLETKHSDLYVFHDPPIHDGWIGKPNAIRHALENVSGEYDWYLFTDADVVFHPSAVRVAIARALEHEADFLTCVPRLVTGSLVEKLILPQWWGNMGSNVPYEHLNHPDALPVGIGAFLLVRKVIYDASGGHGRYPQTHAEDVVLAGVVKEAGGRVDLALAPQLLSVRLYSGWRHTLRSYIAKSRSFGGDSAWYPIGVLSLQTLPALLPLPLALIAFWSSVSIPELDLAILGYGGAAIATYIQRSLSYRRFGLLTDVSACYGWLHPLSGLLTTGAQIVALVEVLRKSPRAWRGRLERENEGLL